VKPKTTKMKFKFPDTESSQTTGWSFHTERSWLCCLLFLYIHILRLQESSINAITLSKAYIIVCWVTKKLFRWNGFGTSKLLLCFITNRRWRGRRGICSWEWSIFRCVAAWIGLPAFWFKWTPPFASRSISTCVAIQEHCLQTLFTGTTFIPTKIKPWQMYHKNRQPYLIIITVKSRYKMLVNKILIPRGRSCVRGGC